VSKIEAWLSTLPCTQEYSGLVIEGPLALFDMVEGPGFPTNGLGFLLFLGEGIACDARVSGPGAVAEDVDSLKAEGVRSEELASPIGTTSLSNIGLRLSEEAEKEEEEAMSIPSGGVVW